MPHTRPLGLRPLPAAIALALTLSSSVHAVEFTQGEVEGSFNSQLTVGASWSTEDADKTLISIGNGGTGYSSTTDDGKLNYEKGDTFSEIIKGVHDLSLAYQNYGMFLRGKYWYDRALEHKDVNHGHAPTGYGSPRSHKNLDDSDFDKLAKFSGAALLDAYIYGEFEVNNMPLDARLGKQVVSWGESTFIRNGINEINPVDVNAFRRPGAEIKEGLLPVNMAYASLAATDNLTLEGFYQLEWQESVIDGCGTFFSTSDPAALGCDALTIRGSQLTDQQAYGGNLYLRRGNDKEADDGGQYGFAARYYSAELNDTEFSLYFMNVHSRAPIFSGRGATGAGAALTAQYFLEYAEDIRLYGASFSTTLGDYSVAGEISYRANQPVQVNTTDLLVAATNFAGQEADRVTAGQDFQGYDRKPVTQLQFTVTRFIEQVMGSSRLTLLGEIGYSHISSLPDENDTRYGKSPVFGLGENCALTGGTARGNDCTNNGYVTANAWGYRLLGQLEYNNVFAGVNLMPRVAFSHDVDGTSATGSFVKDRQALTVGLNADYLNQYTASLSMTTFWGGTYNTSKDRDFASFSLGVSF